MIPDFRYFIERVKELQPSACDRCNLTILLEKRYHDLAEFLAAEKSGNYCVDAVLLSGKCECTTRGWRIRR